MRKFTQKLLMVLSVLIIIISCSSDSDSLDSGDTSFKVKINGEQFEATTISSATILQSNGGQRFDITAENDEYKIIFAIAETVQSQCMSNGDYVNDNSGREVLIFIYYKINGNNYLEHFPVEENNIQVSKATVNSCSNGSISGTFSVSLEKVGVLQNVIVTPDELELTEGEFNNIDFTIL